MTFLRNPTQARQRFYLIANFHSSFEEQPLSDNSNSPFLPNRRNVFDHDELDRLAVDTFKLTFGKNTQNDITETLDDGSHAPMKASILSALAAFDTDDDERDD